MNSLRRLYLAHQKQNFIAKSPSKPQVSNDAADRAFIERLLRAVRPYNAVGTQKVRLGPYRDGGYVMLEPGRGGIAYSLGVSTYSPWDMEMAERDFKVHQYDASITNTPTPHPNVQFHPYFIMECPNLPDNARRLQQELVANGDWDAQNIILQIDVEGAEWEIFAAMDERVLKKFQQIIVEFHELYFDVKKLAILEKLRATHTPVHVHFNNHGSAFQYIHKFIYPQRLLEVSYARNEDFIFIPCNEYFPTPLDAQNVTDKPDVPIGFFDILLEDFNSFSDLLTHNKPPKKIPDALYSNFTMNGKIDIQYSYYDNRTQGHNVHISRHIYETVFKSLEDGTFKYYGDEVNALYDALNDYDISGKRGLIWGLAGCNCEAIALWKNAAEVYVVDYNKPICDHELIYTVTHDELQNMDIQFDFSISFSSFEHDGLGRYGDPVNPDGDLLAMREAKKYLKDNGIMFLSVPLGPDCLCWNAHRIYGPVRLPLLLRGWIPLDVYSTYPSVFEDTPGMVRQPLLVVKQCEPGRSYADQLLQRFTSNLTALNAMKACGTKNEKILGQILEFVLIDRIAACNFEN